MEDSARRPRTASYTVSQTFSALFALFLTGSLRQLAGMVLAVFPPSHGASCYGLMYSCIVTLIALEAPQAPAWRSDPIANHYVHLNAKCYLFYLRYGAKFQAFKRERARKTPISALTSRLCCTIDRDQLQLVRGRYTTIIPHRHKFSSHVQGTSINLSK
jgi:hypothetical protein